MESLLTNLLEATQLALKETELICSFISSPLSINDRKLKEDQVHLTKDLKRALDEMQKYRPIVDARYFAAICVVSTDVTIELLERLHIVSSSMRLYAMLTRKCLKEAWNDIVKAADEIGIPLDGGVRTVISRTVDSVGGYTTFLEFL